MKKLLALALVCAPAFAEPDCGMAIAVGKDWFLMRFMDSILYNDGSDMSVVSAYNELDRQIRSIHDACVAGEYPEADRALLAVDTLTANGSAGAMEKAVAVDKLLRKAGVPIVRIRFSEHGFSEGIPWGLTEYRDSLRVPAIRELRMDSDNARSADEVKRDIFLRCPKLQVLGIERLRTNPKLFGFITLRFTVLASGEISDASIADSSTRDPLFDQEILNAVKRWKLPPIESGTTTVTVSLQFETPLPC
jgi:TonB family protein